MDTVVRRAVVATMFMFLCLSVLALPSHATSTSLPPNCFEGSFRNPDEDASVWKDGCPGYSTCEPGFWCDGVTKHACPPGRFGASPGLTHDGCDGPCDAGHLCPTRLDPETLLVIGSVSSTEHVCGDSTVYCTEGLFEPIPVTDGYYTTGNDADTSNSTRTGQELCEIGYFCVDGIRQPCPAGRYGDAEGMTDPLCSGECEAGYWCPSGSTSATQNECGGVDVFCPAGSDRPTRVRAGLPISAPGGTGGYFTLGGPLDDPEYVDDDESLVSVSTRVREAICPRGHYCQGGVRYKCPAGRYGGTRGMVQEECTGICEQGYYCPEGSSDPREHRCGDDDVYCPEGSGAPTPVSAGYYTVGDDHDVKFAQEPCGPGWWCEGGLRFKCNAGFYGDREAETSPLCSGRCASGYYCDEGSTTPTQHKCGGANVFCVEGSSEPTTVWEGYYTVRVIPDAVVEVRDGEAVWLNAPTGEGIAAGQRVLTGLDTFNFPSGSVDVAGELTHPESLAQYQPIQYHVFPPEGSRITNEDSPILARVDYDTSLIRNWERRCDEGHFCQNGQRYKCPPGRFGDERGLINANCTGLCDAGYYCPVEASTRRAEHPCGGTHLYCPQGSVVPVNVTPGYYTVGGVDESTRWAQEICPPGHYCEAGVIIECPPGRYGATYGLTNSDCSGTCEAGYFCPQASVSATQVPCGNETVFCPEGVAWPHPVRDGFYTAGGRNTEIRTGMPMECRATYTTELVFDLQGPLTVEFDPLRFCESGEIGDNATRSYEIPCEPGHFCVAGLRYECPPGRYGEGQGVTDPQCTGDCLAGWYCPWASTKPDQLDCGNPNLYCPVRSGIPRVVDVGYYTNTSRPEHQRDRQILCEPRYYCVEGLRYTCPTPTYGATYGLHTPECSGLCDPGYYCPDGSIKPTELECGGSDVYCPEWSSVPTPVTPGYWTRGGFEQEIGKTENRTRWYEEECPIGHYCVGGIKYQCPAGVFGNETGMTDMECSGPCLPGYFCPPGSTNNTEYECGDLFVAINETSITEVSQAWLASTHLSRGVAVGAGSAGAGVSGSSQTVTDPALLIPWESGNRVKLPTVEIHVDSIASIHNVDLDAGPSAVYCPGRTDWPRFVRRGYYTVGGELFGTNTTRWGQTMCEPGFFCLSGRKYPCSPGTYGNTPGLSRKHCTAMCPPGYYCPINSTIPVECEDNWYSTGGNWECTECPTLPLSDAINEHARNHAETGSDPLEPVVRCKHSRFCCEL